MSEREEAYEGRYMYGRKKARPWKIFENDAERKRGLANTEVSSLASEGWCIVVGNRGFIKRSVGPTRRNFLVVNAIKRVETVEEETNHSKCEGPYCRGVPISLEQSFRNEGETKTTSTSGTEPLIPLAKRFKLLESISHKSVSQASTTYKPLVQHA